MDYVESELRLYNANSRSHDTGDCVKRALSLAYGLDYDELSSRINKFARTKYPGSAYNLYFVFDSFIRSYGYEKIGKSSQFGFESLPTVEEFAEAYPSGTFCLLCARKNKSMEHLVCVIDGDVWDSWDSQNYYVSDIYQIEGGPTKLAEKIEFQDIADELIQFARDSLEKFRKKMPYARFEVADVIRRVDDYSGSLFVKIYFDQEIKDELGRRIRDYYGKRFILKLNPKWNREENLQKIKDKLYYHLREWTYENRKAIEDFRAYRDVVTHPRFTGDRDILIKLPKELQPKIIWLYDNGSNAWEDRYQAEIEPDPADPRLSEGHTSREVVDVGGETLKELIYNIRMYYSKHWRLGYDY